MMCQEISSAISNAICLTFEQQVIFFKTLFISNAFNKDVIYFSIEFLKSNE